MTEYYALKNNSFKVLTYILMNSNKRRYGVGLYKTIKQLTEDIGISVNTFYLARKDLEEKEYISIGDYGDIDLTGKAKRLMKELKDEVINAFNDY